MKVTGYFAIAIGAMIVLIAFLLDTTVSTSVPDMSFYSLTGAMTTRSAEVANLPKMQLQMMLFGSGAVLILAGSVFAGCGAVIERLEVPAVAITPAASAQRAVASAEAGPERSAEKMEAEREAREAAAALRAEDEAEVKKIMLWIVGALLIIGAIVTIAVALSGPQQAVQTEDVNASVANVANNIADAIEPKAERKRSR